MTGCVWILLWWVASVWLWDHSFKDDNSPVCCSFYPWEECFLGMGFQEDPVLVMHAGGRHTLGPGMWAQPPVPQPLPHVPRPSRAPLVLPSGAEDEVVVEHNFLSRNDDLLGCSVYGSHPSNHHVDPGAQRHQFMISVIIAVAAEREAPSVTSEQLTEGIN